MRASLLTRAGAATAAGAFAVTGAMVTAGAANAATTHVRRLPTHLSIAKRHAVEHHRRITLIGGDLRSHRTPLRGKLVFLERRTPGHKWTVIGHEATGRRGGVAFVVNPKVTARFVLVFKGSPNFQASHSRVVAVKGS
ncbi:MAG: hypothetical protein ACRDPO_34515 [Streptosporangiaceae bacterium]